MEPKKLEKLTARIEKHIRKGQLDKAIDHLKQKISKAPQNGDLHYMLGFVYRNDGQNILAENAFRIAEDLNPDDPGTKWHLAKLLVGLDRPEEGLSYAELSVKQFPSNSQTHAVLGNAYLKLKRYDEAEKSLREAIRLSKWNPDARFWLMEVYEQTERFHLILPALEEYLKDAPDLAYTHVFMAEYLHYDKGDCVAAFPYYEKGLTIAQSGRNSSWYKNYFTTTNYPLAIVDSYAQALIECTLYDAADAVVREHYKKCDLLSWRAYILSEMGEQKRAIENIIKAVNLEPNSPQLRYQYGSFLLGQGDYIDAENEFRFVIDLSQNQDTADVWHFGALAVSLLMQGNSDQANLISNQGSERDAERLWISLAAHHHCAHGWESTIQAGQAALEYDERQDTTLKYMAEAYTHLNQYKEAIETYQQILDFQPRNGRIWRAMGEVYAQAGEIKKAIEALKHAIDEGMLSSVQEKEVKSFVAELQITQ